MKEEDLLAIAQKIVKNIKTEHNINELTQMFPKIIIEALVRHGMGFSSGV